MAFTYPVRDVMAALTHGGAPVTYRACVSREEQVANFVAADVPESIAIRWVDGWTFGGLTDAEAYELIRDKDTKGDWSGKELWSFADVPTDRWFRSAWHRSQNGGPITLDFGRAKAIHFERINRAIMEENAARSEDFDSSLVEIDLLEIRARISKARDEVQLRSIWPLPVKS